MMKMSIKKNKEYNLLSVIAIALFLFSSTCFWEETKLKLLMISGSVIVIITIWTILKNRVTPNMIVNCKTIQWLIINFCLFEIYGLFFLRIGTFNWDFVGFNGVLLICLCILCMVTRSSEQIEKEYLHACKIGFIAIAVYIYFNNIIDLKSIRFGSRLGNELSGNVNTAATCFGIMFIPIIYSIFVKKYRGLLNYFVVVIALICMLLTGSKKGLIIIILSIIMIYFIYKNPIKYFIIPFVMIVGIYAVFNIPVLYNIIGFRVIDMFATFGIGNAVTKAQSTAARSEYIIIGLKSFFNHPIFGGGMNYFQYINNTVHYSHNNYVELLNDFGLIGLMIHYFYSLKTIRFFFKNKNHVPREKRTMYILCITMIIMKMILDIAMVSFTALGIYYLPFIISFMIMGKEKFYLSNMKYRNLIKERQT